MKKVLFAAIALVMTMCFMSCEKDEDSKIKCSTAASINFSYYVDSDTENQINSINSAIEKRLDQIFGETFNLSYDENKGLPTEGAIKSCNEKIHRDSKINEYVNQLRALKDQKNDPAVYYLNIYYLCGNTKVATDQIEFVYD